MEYIPAKSIVNRTRDSGWFGTEYSMNLKLTITTCDDDLAAKVEPRAPAPSRRLAALERYRRRYGSRCQCTSPRARELWELFQEQCGRRGLLCSMRQIVAASRRGYEMEQMSLF